MLDWFTSKFVMMIAVFILIVSVIGFFAIQKTNLENMELQNIANTIASSVNSVSNMNSATSLLVTFNSSKQGVYLKSQVSGKGYNIKLTPNMVMLTIGSNTVTAKFNKHIHIWDPGNLIETNQTNLVNNDTANMWLSFQSGQDFIIEQRLLSVSYNEEYHTFIYRAH